MELILSALSTMEHVDMNEKVILKKQKVAAKIVDKSTS